MAKNRLSLYLISPRFKPSDQHWAHAVVAAADVRDAREIHPAGEDITFQGGAWSDSEEDEFWVAPKEVVVELLGVAEEHVDRGVICASFDDGIEEDYD